MGKLLRLVTRTTHNTLESSVRWANMLVVRTLASAKSAMVAQEADKSTDKLYKRGCMVSIFACCSDVGGEPAEVVFEEIDGAGV